MQPCVLVFISPPEQNGLPRQLEHAASEDRPRKARPQPPPAGPRIEYLHGVEDLPDPGRGDAAHHHHLHLSNGGYQAGAGVARPGLDHTGGGQEPLLCQIPAGPGDVRHGGGGGAPGYQGVGAVELDSAVSRESRGEGDWEVVRPRTGGQRDHLDAGESLVPRPHPSYHQHLVRAVSSGPHHTGAPGPRGLQGQGGGPGGGGGGGGGGG